MGPITLLLGKTRARRARALLTEQLAEVDPSHLLWVIAQGGATPSVRQQLEATLVETLSPGAGGTGATFAPSVVSLSELLAGAWAQVDERSWMAPQASAVIAEKVARDELEWMRRLGSTPLVGGALDRVFTQWVEAGRPPLEGFPRATALREALRAFERNLRGGDRTVHPALALEACYPRLSPPSERLSRWLLRHRVVVFDELLQPSPIRRALLIGLARLWASAGVKVLFTFETGRDLGGAEAGLFFEYDDLLTDYTLRPFAATRPLRRDLFSALIPTGEADILVAGAERTLLVDPLNDPEPAEPQDLSDRMYDREPLEAESEEAGRAWLKGRVRLLECPDTESELRAIARSVKAALLDGAAPVECTVALAGLTDYAPQLRGVFRDHGVPVQLASALPLGRTPGAHLMRELPRVALEGFPADRVLPLMDSGLLALPGEVNAAALLRWCRAAGVRDEPPRRWKAPLYTWMRRTQQTTPSDLEISLHYVQQFCDLLKPLTNPASPRAWRAELMRALETLDVPGRLGRCAEDPELAFENLRAWGAAVQTLDGLIDELERFDPQPWPADRLAAHLDRALDEGTWRPDPRVGAGVRVVDALELSGPTSQKVWLGGLSRGAFLRHYRSAAFLLPRWIERSLEGVDPVAEARYRFGSLLRNALAQGALTLSWPVVRDGRVQSVSPVIQELLSLPTTHPSGLLYGDLVIEQLGRREGAPAGRADALRSEARSPGQWASLLGGEALELTSAQRELHAARNDHEFGAFDGILERPPPPPDSLAVTAVEAYMRCPARYWYQRILGLRSPIVWTPELAADRRGTAFHRILQEFVETFIWERNLTTMEGSDEREEAARTLHALAVDVLEEVASEGGVDGTLLDHLREQWLSGLIDDEPAGTLRVWLDREIDTPLGLTPEAVEQEMVPLILSGVTLKGTLDRLDKVQMTDGEGLLVTDYKTGYAPPIDRVARGLALQPVAYAEFAVQQYGEQPVASVYYVLKRADALERKSWCGDPEVLSTLLDKRHMRYALTLEKPDRERLMDHAGHGVRRLLEGRFHPTLASPADAGCEHCEYRRICRLDVRRADLIDGDFQRPLDPEEA